MYLINRYGILHSYPDDLPLPTGARRASDQEVSAWEKQDAADKAVARQKKREAAAQRAQLVVMSEPARTEDNGKPTAKR